MGPISFSSQDPFCIRILYKINGVKSKSHLFNERSSKSSGNVFQLNNWKYFEDLWDFAQHYFKEPKTCLLFGTREGKGYTVLLNIDQEKKKLLHPKSIPTSQCYYCTLIFNNFEMFRMKIFELKPQTGGVNA